MSPSSYYVVITALWKDLFFHPKSRWTVVLSSEQQITGDWTSNCLNKLGRGFDWLPSY